MVRDTNPKPALAEAVEHMHAAERALRDALTSANLEMHLGMRAAIAAGQIRGALVLLDAE